MPMIPSKMKSTDPVIAKPIAKPTIPQPVATPLAVPVAPEVQAGNLSSNPRELAAQMEALRATQATNQMAQPNSYKFLTDYGSVAKAKGSSGIITADPNKEYVLVNERTKEPTVLYRGTGAEGLAEVYRLSQELAKKDGKKGNWAVYGGTAGTDDYSVLANDDPHKTPFQKAMKTVGKVAAIAAPIAGGVLGTMIPGVGNVIGAGLGSALGSALVGAAKGDAIGKILKSAAISGGTALAGGAILGQIAPGFTAASAAGKGAVDLGANAAVNAGASAAANAGVGGALASSIDDIVVTGLKEVALSEAARAAMGGALGGLGGVGSTLGSGYNPPPSPDDIVNTATRLPPPSYTVPDLGANFAGGLGGALGNIANAAAGATPDPTIDVTAPRDPPSVVDSQPLPGVPVPPLSAVDVPKIDAPTSEKSNIDKYLTYAEWAAKLAGFLGAATDKKSNTMPGGWGGGGLNPIFSGSLPTPNLPGGIGGNLDSLTPRTMPQQNWYKYGMQPEQSFFNYVPQGYTPPQGTTGYAKGGRARGALAFVSDKPLPARGAGGGRADQIPALLSDGEYVMDAETVALLGDGSLDEGTRKLDSLRVNVRKHKGANLAKGKISANARPAERYLGVM